MSSEVLICVLGLSRSQGHLFKSGEGVGKSCLCYRFLHPGFDDFMADHPSILAAHEFQSAAVNSVHWLYWGVNKQSLPGRLGKGERSVSIHVVENTVIYEDVTSKPFKGSSKADNVETYVKRALGSLESSGKISYWTRDGIALPDTYRSQRYPTNAGKLRRGFAVAVDVSMEGLEFDAQIQRTKVICKALKKANATYMLVATKMESFVPQSLDAVQQLKRKFAVDVITTSAMCNYNISATFRVIAEKILKMVYVNIPTFEQAAENELSAKTSAKRLFKNFTTKWVQSSSERVDDIELTEQYRACKRTVGKYETDRIFAYRLLEMKNTEISNLTPGASEVPEKRKELLEDFIQTHPDLMIYSSQLNRKVTDLVEESLLEQQSMDTASNSPKSPRRVHRYPVGGGEGSKSSSTASSPRHKPKTKKATVSSQHAPTTQRQLSVPSAVSFDSLSSAPDVSHGTSESYSAGSFEDVSDDGQDYINMKDCTGGRPFSTLPHTTSRSHTHSSSSDHALPLPLPIPPLLSKSHEAMPTAKSREMNTDVQRRASVQEFSSATPADNISSVSKATNKHNVVPSADGATKGESGTNVTTRQDRNADSQTNPVNGANFYQNTPSADQSGNGTADEEVFYEEMDAKSGNGTTDEVFYEEMDAKLGNGTEEILYDTAISNKKENEVDEVVYEPVDTNRTAPPTATSAEVHYQNTKSGAAQSDNEMTQESCDEEYTDVQSSSCTKPSHRSTKEEVVISPRKQALSKESDTTPSSPPDPSLHEVSPPSPPLPPSPLEETTANSQGWTAAKTTPPQTTADNQEGLTAAKTIPPQTTADNQERLTAAKTIPPQTAADNQEGQTAAKHSDQPQPKTTTENKKGQRAAKPPPPANKPKPAPPPRKPKPFARTTKQLSNEDKTVPKNTASSISPPPPPPQTATKPDNTPTNTTTKDGPVDVKNKSNQQTSDSSSPPALHRPLPIPTTPPLPNASLRFPTLILPIPARPPKNASPSHSSSLASKTSHSPPSDNKCDSIVEEKKETQQTVPTLEYNTKKTPPTTESNKERTPVTPLTPECKTPDDDEEWYVPTDDEEQEEEESPANNLESEGDTRSDQGLSPPPPPVPARTKNYHLVDLDKQKDTESGKSSSDSSPTKTTNSKSVTSKLKGAFSRQSYENKPVIELRTKAENAKQNQEQKAIKQQSSEPENRRGSGDTGEVSGEKDNDRKSRRRFNYDIWLLRKKDKPSNEAEDKKSPANSPTKVTSPNKSKMPGKSKSQEEKGTPDPTRVISPNKSKMPGKAKSQKEKGTPDPTRKGKKLKHSQSDRNRNRANKPVRRAPSDTSSFSGRSLPREPRQTFLNQSTRPLPDAPFVMRHEPHQQHDLDEYDNVNEMLTPNQLVQFQQHLGQQSPQTRGAVSASPHQSHCGFSSSPRPSLQGGSPWHRQYSQDDVDNMEYLNEDQRPHPSHAAIGGVQVHPLGARASQSPPVSFAHQPSPNTRIRTSMQQSPPLTGWNPPHPIQSLPVGFAPRPIAEPAHPPNVPHPLPPSAQHHFPHDPTARQHVPLGKTTSNPHQKGGRNSPDYAYPTIQGLAKFMQILPSRTRIAATTAIRGMQRSKSTEFEHDSDEYVHMKPCAEADNGEENYQNFNIIASIRTMKKSKSLEDVNLYQNFPARPEKTLLERTLPIPRRSVGLIIPPRNLPRKQQPHQNQPSGSFSPPSNMLPSQMAAIAPQPQPQPSPRVLVKSWQPAIPVDAPSSPSLYPHNKQTASLSPHPTSTNTQIECLPHQEYFPKFKNPSSPPTTRHSVAAAPQQGNQFANPSKPPVVGTSTWTAEDDPNYYNVVSKSFLFSQPQLPMSPPDSSYLDIIPD